MANHKSAKKRAIQNSKKNLANNWKKSRMKTSVKKLREILSAVPTQAANETAKSSSTAKSLMQSVQSQLAKLAKTNTIHPNTAKRITSRLASQVAKQS